MKKGKSFDHLKCREDQIFYKGNLATFQQNGHTYKDRRYVRYEHALFTEYQNFLYKRAVFGLSVYEKKELETMRSEKRQRIEKVHRRTQSILNIWKQEIVIKCSNVLLKTFFPTSPLIKLIVDNYSRADSRYLNDFTFKALGITKEHIVKKLIEEEILPANFYELKTKPNTQDYACRISSERRSEPLAQSGERHGSRTHQGIVEAGKRVDGYKSQRDSPQQDLSQCYVDSQEEQQPGREARVII